MVFLKSARSVETITKIGYHRCDRGLYLQVSINGTKSWIFRYKSPVTHKQREMGLGSLNIVSLAKAREMASDINYNYYNLWIQLKNVKELNKLYY
jgi:hypothetical protein